MPSLTDRARIDCLNLLAEKICEYIRPQKMRADSAYPYALLANTAARKIGYKHGIAKSLIRLGHIEDIRTTLNMRSGIDYSSTCKCNKEIYTGGYSDC